MPLSKRLNGLLNWWQLRIEKSREEIKEKNVTRNDIDDTVTASIRNGHKDDER